MANARALASVAVVVSLAVPSSAAASADELPVNDAAGPREGERARALTFYLGSAGASVLDTSAGAVPAAGGSLGAVFPLGRLFALELVGSGGLSAARAEEPNNIWIRLALGLRVERTDGWGFRPYGAFRIVHIHFAKAETWRDYPGSSILGDSSKGLDHRSGLGVAGGFSYGFGQSRFRFFAEIEPSWVPIGRGPKLFAAATVGVGVAL